jgi:DNA-directed RNA polymerase specialized sigma24 family protein
MRSPQGPTVADRLRGARRRQFVGRAAELELLRDALAADEPPFSVLWVHGPGGVGKTTLVGALADEATRLGREPVVLDLRASEPSPPAFVAELARACGRPGGASAADVLAGRERPVLLLDTFEAAPGLEDWLRDEFVPALPAGAVTVIAGRTRPAQGWRRDPGWRDLLRVVSLRNLGPDDARTLLRRAEVPQPLHERVLELTHGHPLALSLLLDVLSLEQHDAPLHLSTVPDVVGTLVESFLAGVPSPRHRMALEVAAHARTTTAAQLRSALGDDDGDELFAWLRELSFVESGPHGLFPHDLARTVIDADLRWRDPAVYAHVHGVVRRDVVGRLTSTEGFEHQRALADLMFLHRGNPAALLFWDWETLGQVYADELRPGDGAAILAMVERHEGPESAAIAARWLERQPSAFSPFRGRGAEPVGFLAQLELHAAGADELERDPAARAAWAHAHRHAPPRTQDEVLLGRFYMDRDAYQAASQSFNVVTIRTTQEWLKRPRLSWYYLAFADPEAVAPLMAYIHFHRAPEADFEVGGRRYGVFARDWRRSGGAEWLELMAERELAGEGPGPPAEPPPPELALSQRAFADAVRRALRDCCRAEALAANPLVRARVVREHRGGGGAALRDLIEDAVDALRADPRDVKLARALERTYLKPAPTQEAAAEVLGLPFSTYRGHLTRGVERVSDWLWQRELYGPGDDGPAAARQP